MITNYELILTCSQFDRFGKLVKLFSAFVSKFTAAVLNLFDQLEVLQLLEGLLDDSTAGSLEVIYRCCSVSSLTKYLGKSSDTDRFLAV